MRLKSYQVKRRLAQFGIRITEDEPPEAAISLYLGIGQDRSIGKLALVGSTERDIQIDYAVKSSPGAFHREDIDPLIGLRSYQVLRMAGDLNLPRPLYRPLDKIAQAMYNCYIASDATILEINPFLIAPDNQLFPMAAKMTVDDNALFRQRDLAESLELSPDEVEIKAMGITYIQLDGQIGCIANGAGLAMATMDIINLYGQGNARPANFLDVGGGADAGKIERALHKLQENTDIQITLINIFGGMTRCDEVAEGIINICQRQPLAWPLVVRLRGTNAQLGQQMIIDACLPDVRLADTMTHAALIAVDKVVTS
ncbi:MAG: succinate--CoA ligase subunit beta [Anaerolineaceae bacterium]|nr:MAG: succinate--CoA ligase subunit beta [Anaerolineaceae bacterium]